MAYTSNPKKFSGGNNRKIPRETGSGDIVTPDFTETDDFKAVRDRIVALLPKKKHITVRELKKRMAAKKIVVSGAQFNEILSGLSIDTKVVGIPLYGRPVEGVEREPEKTTYRTSMTFQRSAYIDYAR